MDCFLGVSGTTIFWGELKNNFAQHTGFCAYTARLASRLPRKRRQVPIKKAKEAVKKIKVRQCLLINFACAFIALGQA